MAELLLAMNGASRLCVLANMRLYTLLATRKGHRRNKRPPFWPRTPKTRTDCFRMARFC
jgi:hypothetical protein